ncbi:hypothetical protein SteCoe_36497 [Stentor coeruleus]|uniref:Uncharacterized protein n=1 Tax=Stentor coeruleus TaxID=5963 RepID=A0A1R2APY9_9CILI|nr:hypothetical protein SteCoe_36497 [Stentor coeruleus]
MEVRQMTQKARANMIISLAIIIALSYVIYIMLESSMSCIDVKGCLKSWCNIDWLPGNLKDAIKSNENC